MTGRTVSHYRIVGQLGAGGMGVVYSADDLRLDRPVALKFLPEELIHDPQAVDRLRSEARAASALNHPNICTIYDIGDEEGHPFIVMELMKGQNLRDRLASGPLKIQRVVDIGIQVADALDAVHARGIIHRDIKPANLFLNDRGQVKILDFGLVKSSPRGVASGTTREAEPTAAGVTLGTIAYMSPEQATGEELDGRTDLFSLGVVLYECATGHRPFTGKTSAVVLSAILNRAPVAPVTFNPEIPLRLQDVINNCLEKDRDLRYQSAADLQAELKRVRRDMESGRSRAIDAVASQPVSAAHLPPSGYTTASAQVQVSTATPVPAPAPPGRVPGRAPLVAATAVGAALLVALGAYVLSPRGAAPPAAATDQSARQDASAVQGRLDLATASLASKNYRAAAAYAQEILALVPDHQDAARLRDSAQAMIERFDAAITEARRRLSAGDLTGAAQALETARSIDATAPSVSELSVRLADQAARPSDSRARPAPVAGSQPVQREQPAVELPRDRSAAQRAPASSPLSTQPAPGAETSRPQPVAPVPSPASAPTPPAVAPTPPAAASAPPVVAPTPPAAPTPQARDSAAATTSPPAAVERKEQEPVRADATAEEEDAAIRRTLASYVRAIETKNLALFRTVRPNLSRDEQRRLEEGFRSVRSQKVELTVISMTRRGQEASVLVRRRDTIQVDSRVQSSESQQTMMLVRAGSGWVISEIR